MPTLLLCFGDPAAKNLLRQAIETRYGINPPAIEQLKLDFKGRARVKVGPITTWVPLDATAYFSFPLQMRMDFVVKPMGLPVQRGVEAFNGEMHRTVRGSKLTDTLTIDTHAESIRRRLWAITALLLTPMSDHTTQLIERGDLAFEAKNTVLNDAVTVHMDQDGFVTSVQVDCWNTDTGEIQRYSLRPSKEQKVVNGLMIPTQIDAYWDDDITFEMYPTHAEINAALADDLFELTDVIS